MPLRHVRFVPAMNGHAPWGGNAPAENLGLRWLYNQNKRAAEEISGPPAQSGQRRLVKVLCYFSL
jgi:hypothetical protein